MSRTIWLGLICLLSMGVLFALRTNIRARTIPGGTASLTEAAPPSAIDDVQSLAKADRLASPSIKDTSGKLVVNPIKIVSTKSESDAPKEASEVTRWHWHEGSKITKRVSQGSATRPAK